ncbi:ATP synthase F1 subunit delta [bacterium]|nr:ATP synthase F1 subunit delta [bacterium]
MSKNKGFSNTSAQRYSLALYELSSESNSLDNIEQNSLAILNLINSSSEISALSPKFLIKKRRFFYLEKILKSFIETCSNKRGEVKAEIQSAKELSSDEIKKITEELTQNFSSKMKLNYKHDKSLIGGLIVKIGSTMVDTSIKNKLQQIENRMIEA